MFWLRAPCFLLALQEVSPRTCESVLFFPAAIGFSWPSRGRGSISSLFFAMSLSRLASCARLACFLEVGISCALYVGTSEPDLLGSCCFGFCLWLLLALQEVSLRFTSSSRFPCSDWFLLTSKKSLCRQARFLGACYPVPSFVAMSLSLFVHLVLVLLIHLKSASVYVRCTAFVALDSPRILLLWFMIMVALGRSRSFSSCLRVRPVSPVVIGFSWPSRSLYAGRLHLLGVFFPRFCFCDVFVASHLLLSLLCCHA